MTILTLGSLQARPVQKTIPPGTAAPSGTARPVQKTPLFLYRSHQKTIAVQKTPPFLYGTPP